MKQILIILFSFILNSSYGQVHVKGYYRSNGTYVQPHVRTSPNSTVTDNYSYPGNYNPNTNTITPTSNSTSNYNNPNNSNTNSSGRVWVNGYYRSDGTYVNGYYRNYPSSNNSNNNLPNPRYKYVIANKVNVRVYPSVNSEIYTTMERNESVKTLNTFDNWTQIELTTYNNYTNSYESKFGYIKSSLLNDTYNTNYTEEINPNNYNVDKFSIPTYKYVKAKKVNVRMFPDVNSKICTTLDWNKSVKVLKTTGNWTQVEFTFFSGYFNSIEKAIGYINTSYLSSSYNTDFLVEEITSNNRQDKIGNKYFVISNKAFFHNKPDKNYIRNAYLLYGEKITSLKESNYYIYILFKNKYGQITKGWIRKDDLEKL